MAAWREEDHPRDASGRFTVKGMAAAASIRRTVAHPQSADDGDLLDVFMRIGGRRRMSKRDRAALVALDAELQRREAGGEPEPTPEARRVEELVAGGASWDEAYREAYGRAGDDQDDAGADRRKGETREQVRRRQFAELTYLAMLAAEDATNGYMVTKEGVSKGIRPASLFSGPRSRADRYASEELKRWWVDNPRRTYAEYRAERVGDSTGARKARGKRVVAGNGRDFG